METNRNQPRNLLLIAIAAAIWSACPLAAKDGLEKHEEISRTIEQGMLIVDGAYIPPPYVFRSNMDGIFVNQTPLDITSLGLTDNDFGRWDMVPPSREAEAGGPD